jgi:hypothetical protein
MIIDTINRKEESSKRLALRSNTSTFMQVVQKGTSCSIFEAEVIADQAVQCFGLGPYSVDAEMQPGQMKWKAISALEPAGKPLGQCEFKVITLTLHNIDEDTEVYNKFGNSAKRAHQIVRMCEEAYEQGALLTQEDLSLLLGSHIRTIRKDIKEYQNEHDCLVPTRGSKKDIGPGVTHRDKALEKFIQGQSPEEIARNIQHSLKAVERYIQSFCRIIHCQKEVRDSLKTALIVGCSMGTVNRCLELRDKYMKTALYQERLIEIEEVGTRFWESIDSKKKLGQ